MAAEPTRPSGGSGPPPAGEEVHLPGPSVLPLMTAVAIALTLVGITTEFVLVIIGLVLLFVCVGIWIRDARREMSALPPSHDGGRQRRMPPG